MDKFSAKLISYLFQPLAIPLFIVLIIFWYTPFMAVHEKMAYQLLSAIFSLGFLLPISVILGLHHFKLVDKITLDKRKDRYIPYVITCICYALLVIFLWFQDANHLLFSIFSIIFLNLLIITIINFMFKISAHAAGVGGLTSITYVFCTIFHDLHFVILFCCVILISGMVLTSRLVLRAHTNLELYTGFLLGLSIAYFGTIFTFFGF